MKLLFKLSLQLFAEPNPGEGDDKSDPNVQLLLEKVQKLEKRIAEQDKQIASVTEFNRKLLDGAKPAGVVSEAEERKKKFDAYMNE